MAVVRCERGHFYDDTKYPNCPHCTGNLAATPKRGISEQQTVFGANLSQPSPVQKIRVEMGIPQSAQDEKTVGVYREEKGFDPVVGWLVCVSGRETGRDYRLFAGRNTIGRAPKNQVVLADDARVTRDEHCAIVFDPRKCCFYIVCDKGNLVMLNGEIVPESHSIAANDKLEIGSSEFVFIPFCVEGRTW